LLLNADLGSYAFALGSAQPLDGGTFHFDLGWTQENAYSRGVEVDATGRTVYALEAAAPAYRSFRLRSLYSGN
jgi:hypothetical protein